MTTTRDTVNPDIAARIVLAFVASKHEAVGESLIRDALNPHMTQAEMRAGLDLLLRAGKVKIIRPGIYEFVEPKPEPGPDVSALIMAYAHGRGIGVEFNAVDLLALPMLAHVRTGDVAGSLKRLTETEQLTAGFACWSLTMPAGHDRELIDRVAGWVDMLDEGESFTHADVIDRFRGSAAPLVRVTLDYLMSNGKITMIDSGTYARGINA